MEMTAVIAANCVAVFVAFSEHFDGQELSAVDVVQLGDVYCFAAAMQIADLFSVSVFEEQMTVNSIVSSCHYLVWMPYFVHYLHLPMLVVEYSIE